jgi:hypothetical protein
VTNGSGASLVISGEISTPLNGSIHQIGRIIMRNSYFYLSILGLIAGAAVVAANVSVAANDFSENGYCDGYYGVAKSNCIQDVRSGRINKFATDQISWKAVDAGTAKPCDQLYGVTKSNCIQDLRSGRGDKLITDQVAWKAADSGTGNPCDNLYGVTKTNCLQDVAVGRIDKSVNIVQSASKSTESTSR